MVAPARVTTTERGAEMLINRNNSKERLLRSLDAYAFMAHEALLYLDAYPNSREALECYNKYNKQAMRTRAEYESKYGPLTPPPEANSWQWTKGPWPWQTEKEDK